MHDLDRALQELEMEMDELESTDYEFESGDYELEAGDYELEAGDYEMEAGDYEFETDGEFEFEGVSQGEWDELETDEIFDEVEEMELAAELLEITDEHELDLFLGKLIRKARKAVRGVVRSPIGKALGGALKGVARKVLPIAGGAVGNLLMPGVGGVAGSHLASMAGRAFGLELEGLSPQDQEFEVARRFVRLAAAATQEVAQNPAGASASDVAKNAVLAAAQRHAPGLAAGSPVTNGRAGAYRARRRPGASAVVGGGRSGRWIRRGRRIILLGI